MTSLYPLPVVTTWHMDLPVVHYVCPCCGAAREASIGRWQKGGALKCIRCGESYYLPTPPTSEAH